MKVGDRITHFGHGPGVIIALNQTGRNKYFEEKPMDAVRLARAAGLIDGLVNSLYSADRYPFIVKFDDGYQDAYAEEDLTVVAR